MLEQSSTNLDVRDYDTPRAVAALFPSEAAGIRALELLHAAGFAEPWLGVTEALHDEKAFSIVIYQEGGSWVEKLTRRLFGPGNDSLYAALTDHGVADDVSRELVRDMPERGVVVIAGWPGDIGVAARVLADAGGDLVRGADAGAIGTPRPRQPSNEAPRTVEL